MTNAANSHINNKAIFLGYGTPIVRQIGRRRSGSRTSIWL